MAEEPTGADSSSDDNLSDDESSYRLHFDLPDNDQTWLYCPPGEDPNSVVDLTEWLSIRPSFMTKNKQTSDETGGRIIDTRTFTRPKKQSVLGNGKNKPQTQKNTDLNVDVIKKKTESTSPTKIPFMTASVKETGPIPSLKSEYAKLQQNKENLILPPYIKTNVQKATSNLTSYSSTDSSNLSFNDTKKSKSRLNDEITLLENISQPQSFFTDFTTSDSCCDVDNLSQMENDPQITPVESVISNLNTTYDTHGQDKPNSTFKQPLMSTPNSRDVGTPFKPTLVSTPIKCNRIIVNIEKQDKVPYIKSENIIDSLDSKNMNLNATFTAPGNNQSKVTSESNLVIKSSNENIIKTTNETSKNIVSKEELTSLIDTTYLVPCEDKDIDSQSNKETNVFDNSKTNISPSYLTIRGTQEKELDPAILFQSSNNNVDDRTNKAKMVREEMAGDSSLNSSMDKLEVLPMAQEEEEMSIKYKTMRKSVSHDSLLSQPESLNISKNEKKKHESVANLTSGSIFSSGLKKPEIRFRTGEEGRYGSRKSFIPACKSTGTTLPPLSKGGSLLQKPIYSVKQYPNQSISKNKQGNEAENQSLVVQKDTKASGIKPPTVISRIPRGVTRIPKPSFKSPQE